MHMDFTKLEDIEVDGVDMTDYPDFCDAYISAASIDGVGLTDEQLEKVNESDEGREIAWTEAYEGCF